MKTEVVIKMMRLEVVKKLWGYIKRKKSRLCIVINIKMEDDKKENVEETVDVEVQNMTKGDLIEAISTHSKLTKADAGRGLNATLESIIKLRTFKATEPEI